MTERKEAGKAAVDPSCLNTVQKMPSSSSHVFIWWGHRCYSTFMEVGSLPLCRFWGSNLSDVDNNHLYLQSHLTGPQNVVICVLVCMLACFETGVLLSSWLAWNSVYRSGWSPAQGSPASASQVLGLIVCARRRCLF